MSDDSTIFKFGNLGYVLCENLECALNLRKLPESSFSWDPIMPHTGYSPRVESVDSLTVIYQPATCEQKVMDSYRLRLTLPEEAVISEKSSEDITRFNYKGLEFVVMHKMVLPPNYQQKIAINRPDQDLQCS